MSHSELLDTSNSIETPEGIEFTSVIAGPVPRILAYLIDFGWRCLFYIVLAIITAFIGDVGVGFFLVLTFLTEWFYPVFFEVFRNGQTPGKKSLNLKVVNDDLTPVNGSSSVIRNLLRSADFIPSLYLFGIISMVLSKKFQRLGDMAAGTIVIYVNVEQHSKTDSSVHAAPPEIPLTAEERKAITNFRNRSDVISESRQVELTDILEPITGTTGSEGLNKIKAISAWLLGRG
ncbi:RDD family protein [Neptuniibacter sp.]|uniref:RDD family protein n=1 Tax=Neptuniibacter sp. TaxID=1962643 RepID=UPI002619A731|nr:RDD family protein [Neptuniibacter sp.]MCP4597235.1 RDD family protein [Neptuniibacter sp.]